MWRCWWLLLLAGVAADFELVVLHTNDMHARFEQTSRYSGKCSEREGLCYGGFARLANKVQEIRDKEENVVFLNAGDTYQGTVWYTLYKWKVVAHFVELLKIDAMSLGNHEFDDNISGLVPFLDNVTCPVLAANIDTTKEPSLATRVRPSVVLQVGGTKIGVIGYVTTETKELSRPGNLEFLDEVQSIRREAERLKREDVKILIAVGHAGFVKDQKIAKEVADIDLVVGGHTNTFLYTGVAPDTEEIQGPYPTLVVQNSGKIVPVVQAYAYTKYLGYLKLTFDDNGELKTWTGNPILLDGSVPQDPRVLQSLLPWKEGVSVLAKKEIGVSRVLLDGQTRHCRAKECNMGNLIADALVYYNAWLHTGRYWTNAPIALYNGGSIRNSIDKTENGSVNMEDLISVLPFGNTIIHIQLKGQHLLETLETSVASYDISGINLHGGFQQASGLHIKYNMSQPPGKRIVDVMARCGDCRVPEYRPINHTEVYNILLPDFIADGGDGLSVIPENALSRSVLDAGDVDILAEYIKRTSPVYPGTEQRIQFVTAETEDRKFNSNTGSRNVKYSLMTILPLALLIRW